MVLSTPTDCSVILTYRCQMRCKMCNIWENPTDHRKEITPSVLEKLPQLKVINITGGEPFVRKDIDEFAEIALRKAKTVVVSTSGWHVDRILSFCEKFPEVGIRISIEGLSRNNDNLRGRDGGFDRAMRVITELKRRGHKNIGFGITVSNHNSKDLLPMYELSRSLGLELATATFHNSFYFHKGDNEVTNKDEVIANFLKLANLQIREMHPKLWLRSLFNLGLIRYTLNQRRMLPCEAGTENFFIYPYGDIYPCNGLEDRYWKKKMGNINDCENFLDLWYSEDATKVRSLVSTCQKNCWMVGTAAPVMKKYKFKTIPWALKAKFRSLFGREFTLSDLPEFEVGQDSRQGDLSDNRPGPVDQTLEETQGIEFIGDFLEDTKLVSSGVQK